MGGEGAAGAFAVGIEEWFGESQALEGGAGAAGEVGEEVELDAGEVDLGVVERHAARGELEREAADFDAVAARDRGASQAGFDVRDEFVGGTGCSR